VRLTVPDVYI